MSSSNDEEVAKGRRSGLAHKGSDVPFSRVRLLPPPGWAVDFTEECPAAEAKSAAKKIGKRVGERIAEAIEQRLELREAVSTSLEIRIEWREA